MSPVPDRYAVAELGYRTVAGDSLYVVVRYRWGECTEDSHQFVRRRYAERVAAMLTTGHAAFNAPSSQLAAAWPAFRRNHSDPTGLDSDVLFDPDTAEPAVVDALNDRGAL